MKPKSAKAWGVRWNTRRIKGKIGKITYASKEEAKYYEGEYDVEIIPVLITEIVPKKRGKK